MTDMPQPIGYVEFEGDYIMPWVPVEERFATRDEWERVREEGGVLPKLAKNPDRVHAIFFDDGNAFDMVNGWRSDDAEKRADTLASVKAALASSEGRHNGHDAPPPHRTKADLEAILDALVAR